MVSFKVNYNCLMDDWPQWRSKIIEMGKVESSTWPNIKKYWNILKRVMKKVC